MAKKFAPILVFAGLSAFLLSRQSITGSDVLFIVLYPLYIYLANNVCFNSNELALSRKDIVIDSLGQGQFKGQPAFRKYMIAFKIFAVLLPLFLIVFAPPQISAGTVSPLVLLLVQIVTEKSTQRFHDVLRILVPIGFNAYRLKGLYNWVESALLVSEDHPWYYVGLTLSTINLIIWSYNLFVFLLLRMLPVYFDKDYTPPVEMAYSVAPIPKTRKKIN
eukprot:CAMPEP_0194083188 /NCGR_PEP_ID=MMETSP0149-20130528/8497_1 /TAXON_ID=122233 /ORGANISM="Chaetoceros debilis, Strain MM31A-1" /LENGTH=218 /DNA_ID=CAMNT_0038765529 /DNA_START=17 /DNA_END=673 /DNA_ORIENTATION=+